MKVRLCLVLLTVVLAATPVSFGKTLFGQNYTALFYSYYDYGDGDLSYLDDSYGGTVLVNINDDADQDFQLGVSYVDADGERNQQDVEITTLTFKADIVHTFCESETVKPYINFGLRILDMDVTGPATEEDDTDVALGIGIGIEFELARS